MFSLQNIILLLLCSCLVKEVYTIQYMRCECGISNNMENRIVGGWSANPHEFPWLVAVMNKNKLYCGGSIINDRYILTAGHCVRWAKKSDLTITVGMHDRRERSEADTYPVAELILHEHFYSHKLYDENDIALIKLYDTMVFNSRINPVCLPKPNSSYSNKFATVAGWGKLGANKKIATILQQTLVKVLTHEQCTNTSMKPYLNDDILCAYFDRTDACQGDSGGPLVYEREPGKTEQIGVVSWGIGCASPDIPGIYTKVTSFLDWIYRNTRDAYYCPDE